MYCRRHAAIVPLHIRKLLTGGAAKGATVIASWSKSVLSFGVSLPGAKPSRCLRRFARSSAEGTQFVDLVFERCALLIQLKEWILVCWFCASAIISVASRLRRAMIRQILRRERTRTRGRALYQCKHQVTDSASLRS